MHKIDDYYNEVTNELEKIRYLTKNIKIEFDKSISLGQGILKGSLVFLDNSVLHFNELVSDRKKRYRFHYMKYNNDLIMRWDSSPHYKNISTFPYHIHMIDQVKPSSPVTFVNVLNRIEKIILDSLNKK